MITTNPRRTHQTVARIGVLAGLSLATLAAVGCDKLASAVGEGALDKTDVRSKIIPIISSARFKTNVATVSDALSRIERLRGVTFDYKPEFGAPNQLGFIAEEAADVLPQSVVRDEQGRPYAMNYVAVVPVTVEAIKELSAENTTLKNRLAALEAAVQSLNNAR